VLQDPAELILERVEELDPQLKRKMFSDLGE
jgi:hypothetical protein